MNGILPVWKPTGCTSHDAVKIVRRLSGQKKVGHTGTLDPAVQGVLPICLGKATRVAEYLQNQAKTYEGTLTLGIATDTQDQDGTVIGRQAVRELPVDELADVFHRFTGEIEQTPPMYSAVKVRGRRLYELAREGKDIEREARKVRIYRLELVRVRAGDFPQIDFIVECSKGTYIRTLCVDIGRALGVPAHLSHLVRIQSGPFTREQCVTLTQLEQTPLSKWKSQWLCPLDAALDPFPAHSVSPAERHRIATGQPIHMTTGSYQPNTLLRVYAQEEFLALYKTNDTGTRARPVKVFVENR